MTHQLLRRVLVCLAAVVCATGAHAASTECPCWTYDSLLASMCRPDQAAYEVASFDCPDANDVASCRLHSMLVVDPEDANIVDLYKHDPFKSPDHQWNVVEMAKIIESRGDYMCRVLPESSRTGRFQVHQGLADEQIAECVASYRALANDVAPFALASAVSAVSERKSVNFQLQGDSKLCGGITITSTQPPASTPNPSLLPGGGSSVGVSSTGLANDVEPGSGHTSDSGRSVGRAPQAALLAISAATLLLAKTPISQS